MEKAGPAKQGRDLLGPGFVPESGDGNIAVTVTWRFKNVGMDFMEKSLIPGLEKGKYQVSHRLVGPENKEVLDKERFRTRSHKSCSKVAPMARLGMI